MSKTAVVEKIPLKEDDLKKIEGIAHNLLKKLGMNYDPQLLQDLVSEGKVGYYSAMKRYDTSKNSYFWGFAYRRVQGSMLDYIRKYVRYNKRNMVANVVDIYSASGSSNSVVSGYDFSLSLLTTSITLPSTIYQEDMLKDFITFIKKEITVSEFNILYDYFVRQEPVSKLSVVYDRPAHRIMNIIQTLSKQIYSECFQKYD